jgi:MFS transporter, ACS family, glucarate transporter
MGTQALPIRPTRARFVVLTYLCLLTFILYLDRVCIGQAGPAIQAEMKLNEAQLGYVFASFTLAYGLFMTAAGRLGDRYGSRGVLVAIVVWWSVFTALTGASTSLIMLLVVRFVFGAGEAGALPNCARVLSRWFPAEARGFPQGLLNTAALVGGAVAPFAAAWLMELLDHRFAPFFLNHFGSAPIGWRWTFVLFGVLGLIWGAAFWYAYHDDPGRHPRVNQAELDYIRRGRLESEIAGRLPPLPWRLIFRSRNIWLMGFIISCASFASYLYLFWLPTYLQRGRGAGEVESGTLAMMVLAGGALGSALGGTLCDYSMRRAKGNRRVRSLIGMSAMGLSALALFGSLFCDDVSWACTLVAIAFFLSMSQIATWWGVVGDISGQHVAALFGLMNSMGIVGGVAAQVFFGSMAKAKKELGLSGRDQWDPALYYFVVVLLLGAVAWIFVDSNKSAVEEVPRRSPGTSA